MDSPKSANKFMMWFLIYSIISVFIIMLGAAFWMYGKSEKEVMQFMLLSQDFVVFIIPMAVYLIFTGKSLKDIVPLKKLSLKNAVYVVVITLLIMPVMMVFSRITDLFVNSDVNDSFNRIMLDFPWWVSVIFMAVMPPLCEETMFRGYILSGYKRIGFAKAAIISGLFFGMMHLDLYQLPYAAFAGIVMAGFVFYTGSIYSSMLAHFVVNGSQTAMFLIAAKMMDPNDLEQQLSEVITMDEKLAGLYAAMALMIICLPFLLFAINRFVKRNRVNYIEYCTDSPATESYNFEEKPKNGKFADKYFYITILVYILYMLADKFILSK